MSQAAGLLTGSALTGSGVDRVGSKSGSGVDRVGQNPGRVKNPGRAQTGSEMTSASGLTGSKTDRVRDWVGHAYWVKLTSANQ